MRVLIIENDPDHMMVFCHICEAEGWFPIEVLDSSKAFEVACKEMPDAIWLDIVMPDLHGWEVLEQLDVEPTRDIPVVIVTAMASPQTMSTGRASRAIEILAKPFDPLELVGITRQAVGE